MDHFLHAKNIVNLPNHSLSDPLPTSTYVALSKRKKLFFGIVTVVALGLFAELFAYACGIRPAIMADPYVGFSSHAPLFVESVTENGDRLLVTAAEKEVWFNRQQFAVPKKPVTWRVFCVGGSTTYGRPFADATSYSGYLRKLLPFVDTTTNYEVINAGGVSYASYRVATVMEELANFEPDLFIVYSVHNEFLERRTYAEMFTTPQWKMNIESALRKTHAYTALERIVGRFSGTSARAADTLSAEVDERLNHTAGPEDYTRDEAWQASVLKHYEFNLNRMIAIARHSGAQIVFIEPASNEKDCSPFKTDELYYDDGRDLFELGHYEEAQRAFSMAIDRDICPLRATSRISEIVRRVTSDHNVPLVPFEQKLREDCRRRFGHECLGDEYFMDHVHPTIDVHRSLATWIIQTMLESGICRGQPLDEAVVQAVDDEIRQAIVPRDHGVALRNLAKVLHWAGKFEEAQRRARDALLLLPDDAASRHVLADCLTRLGQTDEAIQQYELLFQKSDYERAFLPYAALLVQSREYEAAKLYLIMATASERKSVRDSAFELLVHVHQQLGETELANEAQSQWNSSTRN